MTFVSCDCPLPTAIGSLTAVTCNENLAQIVKIIFQRKQATPSFPAQDGTVGGAGLLASWTPFFAAVDATKVQGTPEFSEFVIPQVEGITYGGDDNSTIDGRQLISGASTVRATGAFLGLPAANLKELKEFSCENALTVYMVNEFGKVIGSSPDGTKFEGIEITTFFIGDGGNEGKNTFDKTTFGFNFKYGWRDNLAIVTGTDFSGRSLG